MGRVESAAARVVLACIIAGGLVGCGDDSGGGTDGGTDTGMGTDTGLPPGDPIVVGQILEDTGFQAARSARWSNAVALAVSQINAAGGIEGRPLMLDARDGESSSTVAPMRMEDLLSDHPNLQAVLAGGTSGTAVAVGAVAAENGVPMITGTASVDWLGRDRDTLEPNDNGYVFRTQGTTSEQVEGLVELMNVDGIEKIVVLWFDNVFTTNYRDSLEARWSGGAREITFMMEHTDTIEDPAALIAAAAATSPDAIVMLNFAAHAAQILTEWRDNGGYDGAWYLINSTCDRALLDEVGGDALEGFSGVTVHQETGARAQGFAEAYETAYGSPHGGLDDQWYDAAMLVGLAIAKAGPDASPEAVRDALLSVSRSPGMTVTPSNIGSALTMLAADPSTNVNYEGASGSVNFDDDGDITKGIDLCEITGGEIVLTPIQ